jgi:zinc protease
VVVAGEFQRNESNPFFFLLQDMDKHLWGDKVSRKNSIGRYEVILNATPQIMQKIKDMYYYPNNSMLIVAGDVNHNQVFTEVDKLFNTWEASKQDIFKTNPIPVFSPLDKNTSFITENENNQVPIYLQAWHGPDTRNNAYETIVADVFSTILQQKSSKFQKKLIESGLAYEVQVSYQTCKYIGPINVILVPDPAKMKEAIKALEAEIKLWSSPGYFTEDELQTAKDMLEISNIYGKEKCSEYVHSISYFWASADLNYFYNYVEEVKKVNQNDISAFVKKYIDTKKSSIGVLISPEQRKEIKLDTFFKTIK